MCRASTALIPPNDAYNVASVIVPIDDGFESSVMSFVSTDGGATYTGPSSVSFISSHFVRYLLRATPYEVVSLIPYHDPED